MNILIRIFAIVNQGGNRSINAKKNIIASFALKGISILVSLLVVPLTLNYLDQTQYGIWLTLSSIVGWISFFDIGLGNGFRNKFAEARAQNRNDLAKIYVSTTFALLIIVISFIFLLFTTINPFLNWVKIINTDESLSYELSKTMFFVVTFFCFQFVFKVINMMLFADQKSAKSDLINVLGSILALLGILTLKCFTSESLFYIGFVFSIAPLLVLIVAYFVLFYGDYKEFRPSIKTINFSYSKDLMGLGLQFFIIKITSLILFTTSNIIISQLLGPKEVTPYNIAFKYLSITTMAFNIIISPFWSAYTEAFHKNDFQWIKNSTKRLIQIWILISCLTVVMILISKFIYSIWIGEKIDISIRLTALVGIYNILFNWSNIFAFFLNGIGKIRVETFSAVISSLVFIPMTFFLGKKIGIEGVLISMCLSMVYGAFLNPIQYRKIISGKAKGIWNK